MKLGGTWRATPSERLARNLVTSVETTDYGQSRLRNRKLEQTQLNRCILLQGGIPGRREMRTYVADITSARVIARDAISPRGIDWR